jgi:hypothetical protein
LLLVSLGLMVVVYAGLWATFVKAGEPGWAAIVPVYNLIVLLRIAGKPTWWVFFIPLVPVWLVLYLFVMFGVARHFGQGILFGLGLYLLPFIFFPILGYGTSQFTDH